MAQCAFPPAYAVAQGASSLKRIGHAITFNWGIKSLKHTFTIYCGIVQRIGVSIAC